VAGWRRTSSGQPLSDSAIFNSPTLWSLPRNKWVRQAPFSLIFSFTVILHSRHLLRQVRGLRPTWQRSSRSPGVERALRVSVVIPAVSSSGATESQDTSAIVLSTLAPDATTFADRIRVCHLVLALTWQSCDEIDLDCSCRLRYNGAKSAVYFVGQLAHPTGSRTQLGIHRTHVWLG
jgi:hypothetical protein